MAPSLSSFVLVCLLVLSSHVNGLPTPYSQGDVDELSSDSEPSPCTSIDTLDNSDTYQSWSCDSIDSSSVMLVGNSLQVETVVATQPTKPAEQPQPTRSQSSPSRQSSQPDAQPSRPATQSSPPRQSSQPAAQPTRPATQSSPPRQSSQPAAQPTRPATQSSPPRQSSQPAAQPTRPETQSSPPRQSSQPAAQPTRPATQSSPPRQTSQEPKPTEPSRPTTQSSPPRQSSQPASEPRTSQPSRPTTQPVSEPRSTQPSRPTTQPVSEPRTSQPIRPPTQPVSEPRTSQPARPTTQSQPAEPTQQTSRQTSERPVPTTQRPTLTSERSTERPIPTTRGTSEQSSPPSTRPISTTERRTSEQSSPPSTRPISTTERRTSETSEIPTPTSERTTRRTSEYSPPPTSERPSPTTEQSRSSEQSSPSSRPTRSTSGMTLSLTDSPPFTSERPTRTRSTSESAPSPTERSSEQTTRPRPTSTTEPSSPPSTSRTSRPSRSTSESVSFPTQPSTSSWGTSPTYSRSTSWFTTSQSRSTRTPSYTSISVTTTFIHSNTRSNPITSRTSPISVSTVVITQPASTRTISDRPFTTTRTRTRYSTSISVSTVYTQTFTIVPPPPQPTWSWHTYTSSNSYTTTTVTESSTPSSTTGPAASVTVNILTPTECPVLLPSFLLWQNTTSATPKNSTGAVGMYGYIDDHGYAANVTSLGFWIESDIVADPDFMVDIKDPLTLKAVFGGNGTNLVIDTANNQLRISNCTVEARIPLSLDQAIVARNIERSATWHTAQNTTKVHNSLAKRDTYTLGGTIQLGMSFKTPCGIADRWQKSPQILCNDVTPGIWPAGNGQASSVLQDKPGTYTAICYFPDFADSRANSEGCQRMRPTLSNVCTTVSSLGVANTDGTIPVCNWLSQTLVLPTLAAACAQTISSLQSYCQYQSTIDMQAAICGPVQGPTSLHISIGGSSNNVTFTQDLGTEKSSNPLDLKIVVPQPVVPNSVCSACSGGSQFLTTNWTSVYSGDRLYAPTAVCNSTAYNSSITAVDFGDAQTQCQGIAETNHVSAYIASSETTSADGPVTISYQSYRCWTWSCPITTGDFTLTNPNVDEESVVAFQRTVEAWRCI